MKYLILGVLGWMVWIDTAFADTWTGRVLNARPTGSVIAFEVEVQRNGVVDRTVTLSANTAEKSDVQQQLNDYLTKLAYEESHPVTVETATLDALGGISKSVDSDTVTAEDLPIEQEPVDVPVGALGGTLGGTLAGLGIATLRGRRRKEPS